MAKQVAPDAPLLSDNEGSVLGLVARRQPVSTYQLLRIFEQSPVTSLNESKGTIYPVVRRLKAGKLLSGRILTGDARKTEVLSCTAKGLKALRRWVLSIPASSILPEDPLRTRLLSFELLTPEERKLWVRNVEQMIADKIEEIAAFGVAIQMPYWPLVLENLELSLRARTAWLKSIGDMLLAATPAPTSRPSNDAD